MPASLQRLRLLRVAFGVALGVCLLKVWLHRLGWQPLAANPLVSALVAATVFLLGFLLSGVLSDYKESERLPGELGAALQCLVQEVRSAALTLPDCSVEASLAASAELGEAILAWVRSQEPPSRLQPAFTRLYEELALVGRLNPPPLQARLLHEVANLQRAVVRIATIRDMAFVHSVYLLATLASGLLVMVLMLSRSGPLPESLLFLAILTVLLVQLLYLIADLDNPFNHGTRNSLENVSLEPFQLAVQQMVQLGGNGQDRRGSGPSPGGA
jgi:hypothetical protein